MANHSEEKAGKRFRFLKFLLLPAFIAQATRKLSPPPVCLLSY